MMVAIMIVEGSLVFSFHLKPLCDSHVAGFGTRFVDVWKLLPLDLLSPLSSGSLVAFFVSHRHRYVANSKLHLWTLRYAVLAFALSWTWLLRTLLRCSAASNTILTWLWRICVSLNVLATTSLTWLSLLKLRCFVKVAPIVTRVGDISCRIMIMAIGVSLILNLFGSEHVDVFYYCGVVVGFVSGAVFFGSLVIVLSGSVTSAVKEASHSDLDDESARHMTNSACWTRWTLIVTAIAGSTFLANWISLFNRRMEESDRAIILYHFAFALDLLTNVIASAFLSGLLVDGDRREYGTAIFRVAAASARAQKRRRIETRLKTDVGDFKGSALTLAYLMDGVAPIDVLQEAESRFRCIVWETLAVRPEIITCGGPLEVIGPGGNDLYSLSEPCDLGDCDAFISHSWHDNGLQKWEVLRSWCDNFVEAQGYQPRLWIDKCCICQNDIATDLRSLPVFIAGCKTLLVISGPTYPTRLWCAMELLVHRAMIANDANQCPPELLLLGDDEQRKSLEEAWRIFDVTRCQCFNQGDKQRFLRVVDRYPGGSAGFNRFIRQIITNSLGSSEVATPGNGYDFTERC
eukprot:TRINITY_DN4469_c0_g1_i10.p1 TRINITY_DN4469_c0_g1~~TRINITY_DN4469_c0_g1_i10.p1  ORF type:complete len:638 (-),score=52.65 TRINITY_DN4469_c0_g1_i10:179-1900(-)